jgi:gliding motility-associated-like protein
MPNGKGFFQDSTIAPDGASMDFKWDFGDGSQSISRNPVHTYVSTPTNTPPSVQVTMIASTVYGCSDTAVKTFDMFFDKPTASFAVVPDNLCEDNEVVITGVPPATGSLSSWYWELGDDSTSDLQSLTHIYKDPGNYTIKLVVENAVGCPSDTITGEVIVNLQPVVDAGWSFVVPQGTTIKLAPIVNDSSVVTYLWTPQGDITDPTVLRPVFQARNNNVYTLTVTGPGGCTASDSISVKILLPFEIPNAFSPNGDNINDFWEIDRINEYPGVTIQVFNRYGQIVYNSVGYGKPWDGTSNGKPLPVATYYYVIKPMNGLDPIAGSVTIIR